jgi:hypothetical protein
LYIYVNVNVIINYIVFWYIGSLITYYLNYCEDLNFKYTYIIDIDHIYTLHVISGMSWVDKIKILNQQEKAEIWRLQYKINKMDEMMID